MEALFNARLLTPDGLGSKDVVLIEHGRIVDIVRHVPENARPVDLGGGILAPGFIDVQVNGGGGVLFNDAPSVETIARIAAAHRRFGTTGLLPTYVTGPDMAVAAEAVAGAIEARVPGVLGIHFEGPHISAAKRGVHDQSHISKLADANAMPKIADGVTLMTLAPECVPPEAIQAMVAQGVIVSAGHTEADCTAVQDAFAAGATGVTHLFNAMSPLESRAPGAVGAALTEDGVWCGIIVDGHHVHYKTVELAWRAKPRGKLILVTDAMPPVGADVGSFMLGDQRVNVEGGRCVTAEGRLAGSALDMAQAVRNCVHHAGIPLDEALQMASAYPADFLGLSHKLGRTAPGYTANFVLLDDALQVRATWIDGAAEWYDGPAEEGGH